MLFEYLLTSDLPKSGVGISEVSRYSCCLSTCLPQIYLSPELGISEVAVGQSCCLT